MLIFGGQRNFPASVEWLRFGGFAVSFGFKFDDLAALMLFVVSFVASLSTYSARLHARRCAKARFFGGLSVFMFRCAASCSPQPVHDFVFWSLLASAPTC